ncbi:hypothetical protein FCL40_10285 [Ferrimonas sediminicola]|uniref:PilZ domain-containing protein n=1 Tax=Ferrimonas sediminicola TaxID=2569538 RepID=A0A4U1BDZ8_9GAMM|nr:hypothetical protein [Ferrimonas sediminicola]TKB49018.1 hypothetical protein FCL40_10285 [Ferrimonas sediminicola]
MSETQQSFFSVPCEFTLFADPLPGDKRLVDADTLLAMMPRAFRLMAQVNEVEQRCQPLMASLSQQAAELAEYLSLQNLKLDMVLQMQLEKSTEARYRCQGVRFGGSGALVRCDHPLEPGAILEIKILIPEENVAVFAVAELTGCEREESGYSWTLDFTSIIEGDQERLVHASLQVEQRMLRARAQARREQQAP